MIKTGFTTFRKNRYSPIGLDIGSSSVKMAQLQKTASGWTVSALIEREIKVTHKDSVEDRSDAIVQCINECMRTSSFSGRSVICLMPGYQLDIFPVKLSLSEDESVEDAILEYARAHLSYDADDAVIDYLSVDDAESVPGEGHETRCLLIAAQREDVDSHLSIMRKAYMKPVAMDIAACALVRVLRYSRAADNKNVLVINSGKLHTSLTLIWKDNILFDRNILWGSENILENLMIRLKLDQQKATDLLYRIGMRFRHGGETAHENDSSHYMNKIAETVYEISAPQLEKLAREIDKVVQYFSSEMRGAGIDALYLSGSVSAIKDLDTYLGKRTGIQTKSFDPLRALKEGGKVLSKYKNGYASSFGVALGLAMRGFENQRIQAGGE